MTLSESVRKMTKFARDEQVKNEEKELAQCLTNISDEIIFNARHGLNHCCIINSPAIRLSYFYSDIIKFLNDEGFSFNAVGRYPNIILRISWQEVEDNEYK